jgi:hypothetical protein
LLVHFAFDPFDGLPSVFLHRVITTGVLSIGYYIGSRRLDFLRLVALRGRTGLFASI